MGQVRLTKRIVDAAEPRPDRYTIFDNSVAGFGLRVYPSGLKSWIFEYRPGDGGRRVAKKRVTIGRVHDFTPDKARKIAEKLRGSVKTGLDPQGERSDHRKAPTVGELAEIFLGEHVSAKRKAGTKQHYQDVLNRLVVPHIGKTKAKDLKRADVARLHLANRRTPFQANRIVAILSSM